MSEERHSYHDNIYVVSVTQSLTWGWGTAVASGQKHRREHPGRQEIRVSTSAGKQRVRDFASGAIYFLFFFLGCLRDIFCLFFLLFCY